MRSAFLFPAALVVLCLTGCQVPLQSYHHPAPVIDPRTDVGQPNSPRMQPVSDVKESGLAIPARCDISRSSVCLQFLQLDDMGEMLNPEELPAVLNTIGRANAQAGPSPDTAPIVIAFVHGWNHNADERDPKVRGFSEFLERLSAAYEARRKIVGIYIGWRGEISLQLRTGVICRLKTRFV